MTPIKKPGRVRMAAATSVAAGLIAATVGFLVGAPGSAGAVPVSLTLNYSCTFPLIGAQPMTVQMNSDIPSEATVGVPTGEFVVNAVTTVNEAARNGMRIVGATTLEGTVKASASLAAPNLNLPLTVPITIPQQPIPATTGSFTVNANGKTPSLTFGANNVGTATVKVSDLVLTITPKDANGQPTGLGTFDAPCTMDAGQNNTLATLQIKGGGGTTVPTTTPTTSPTTTPTTSPTTTPTTAPQPLEFKFNLNGTSFIKAANGNTALKGNITAKFDLASGTHTSDLVLDPTTGSFNILGFLPVTSNIEFEQVGKTTGTLKDGKLTSSSKMFVKLTNVLAFGILPIGGGPDCKTTEPATIDLATPAGQIFNPLQGGKLVGEYTLPGLDAANCGGLGGIISIFMAGPGNTIDMDLTKA
jgi:hypothetical protein